MKSKNVVVAIIKKNHQYLIVQRNRNKHLGLEWEFPGGKVDDDETFSEALSREIKEELDIIITMHEKIAEEKYKDSKIDVILYYYLCSFESGTMKLNEHEDFVWVKKKILINMILLKGTEIYYHLYNFFV